MKVVFGGTFDPVHKGHLQMATELQAFLSVKCVYLMPCFQAVHKCLVNASAEHRLNMLQLSVQGNTALVVDDREVCRSKPSFTIDSMREIRNELGNEPLCFVMGIDAAKKLAEWRDVEKFCKLSHLVIINRLGDESGIDQIDFSSLGYKKAKSSEDLEQEPSGYYLFVNLSGVDISSTMVRQRVNKKSSIRSLVTDAVDQYICDNGLYQ